MDKEEIKNNIHAETYFGKINYNMDIFKIRLNDIKNDLDLTKEHLGNNIDSLRQVIDAIFQTENSLKEVREMMEILFKNWFENKDINPAIK